MLGHRVRRNLAVHHGKAGLDPLRLLAQLPGDRRHGQAVQLQLLPRRRTLTLGQFGALVVGDQLPDDANGFGV